MNKDEQAAALDTKPRAEGGNTISLLSKTLQSQASQRRIGIATQLQHGASQLDVTQTKSMVRGAPRRRKHALSRSRETSASYSVGERLQQFAGQGDEGPKRDMGSKEHRGTGREDTRRH